MDKLKNPIFLFFIGLGLLLIVYRALTIDVEIQVTPVLQVFPHQDITVINASGYVVAQRQASLSSKATGRLEWLGVSEGSKVKKNEIIARLESDDLMARVNFRITQVGLAKVELDDANRSHDRAKQLLAKRFISKASFDETLARLEKAKASYNASKASLDIASADLDQSEIRAPFDGVVLTKNANVGDNITPFSAAANTKGAVVTIADMSTLEVEVDVSESNVSKIYLNQSVVVSLDAIEDEKFYGYVSRMVPTIDRAKATRMIKVGFLKADSRILPDMSAKVAFLSSEIKQENDKPHLAIIKDAVLNTNEERYFFVVEKNKLRREKISSEIQSNSDFVAVKNVSIGDKVVLKPPKKLENGSFVRVIE